MTNPEEAVHINCEALEEVHIIDSTERWLFRIIPQKCLGGVMRISFSVIEKGHFAAGRGNEIVFSHDDYEIEGTRIKFNVKATGEDEFDFLVEAPEGWKVLEESQPLSTERFS